VADDVVDDLDRAKVRSDGRLSALQRESVELAFYGGNTRTEISPMLGLPLGTVKTRIATGSCTCGLWRRTVSSMISLRRTPSARSTTTARASRPGV
jgi:DNA-directed RNA polymerase specialized sigma24 family protein